MKVWPQHLFNYLSSDNERQRVVQWMTTNDNEWQRVTMNGNKWQLMTTSNNEWYNEWKRWYNEWKQMRIILGYTMKQLCIVKLQYMQQRLFENIM